MRREMDVPASRAVACPKPFSPGEIPSAGPGPHRGQRLGKSARADLQLSLLLAVLILAGPVFESEKGGRVKEESLGAGKKHILLLGASVGRAWNIKAVPTRVGNVGYTFEYVHGGSSFDKSHELRKILQRTDNRPDAIFLKECAAYFPGNTEAYKALMTGWIRECRKAGIVPIPTTVVPVTLFHAYKKFGIDILKLRNPFKFGLPFGQRRLKTILEYNDWIREYCRANGLAVLDLEAAVRRGPKRRSLRSGLARVDGLHLKPRAYVILDQAVVPALAQVRWPDGAGAGIILGSER